jgi:DNA replication and repair protein RecF
LALRLAGHEAVSDVLESPPVLLLDDVFSELDAERSEALLDALPDGQALLTTAAAAPVHARPALVLKIEEGKVLL